jgi:uncharacterized membrane protein
LRACRLEAQNPPERPVGGRSPNETRGASDVTTPHTATAHTPWILPVWQPRALTIQGLLLLSAAWLLPAAAHLAGLTVRTWLPMHWPVLLAGLCYGWRAGALVGAGAPVVSYLLSGMPPPVIIPAMTMELCTYGFLAGFVREVLHRGRIEAAIAAVLGGRVLFVGVALATGAVATPLPDYLRSALLPGIAAAVVQILLLPLIARWWVAREQTRR